MTDIPRLRGMLDVGDGQQLYWEEWGASDGIPALYLHGGPGGTLGASGYRARFDLTRTRVIGFDQRGCGRSTPHASEPETSLETNTTAHLVRDIEALRRARGVESWIVNGVSWGTTLALAYAQAHPARVLGMVLVAVTSTSRQEVDWVTEGMGSVFPEAWDRFASHAERSGIGYRRGHGRLVEAYSLLLNSANPAIRDAASREWALWEDTHVSIGAGGFARDPRWENDAYRLAFARLTTHYWSHDGFNDIPLAATMQAMSDIPGTLIHGRRDVSGPAFTAWDLHRKWPASTLHIDEGDGHGGTGMEERWARANSLLVAGGQEESSGSVIRYESAHPSARGTHTGIFGLMNHLGRSGKLSADEHEQWRAGNDWFNEAYLDPTTVDVTVYDRKINPLAAAWFKSSATHLVERVPMYLAILRDHGVDCVRRESRNPGRIIYEDDVQIVVVPHES